MEREEDKKFVFFKFNPTQQDFNKIGHLPHTNLDAKTPEQAAYFIVNCVNEMVPNSNTRSCTVGFGEAQPFLLGATSDKNTTMEYDKIIGSYRNKIAKQLGKNGDLRQKIGLVAQEAIKTHCGDCEEMTYVGALVLRNNAYQGNISIMSYGPEDDANSLVCDEGNQILVEEHLFLLLEDAHGNDPWVADIWAKKSFPYSKWKEELRGYGLKLQMDSFLQTKYYGQLVSADKMPQETPREFIKFSDVFPPLTSSVLEPSKTSSYYQKGQ